MRTICLHEQETIYRILARDMYLNLYGIGDLDPQQWPYTTWYTLAEGEEILEIALLYRGFSLPVLLAFSSTPERMAEWLSTISHLLPRNGYAHLSVGVEMAFQKVSPLTAHGLHLKLALRDPARLAAFVTTGVTRLRREDALALRQLYAASYPGNYFDESALEIGPFYGIWQDTRLICAAGIHIFSRQYGVAALGNIATHPEYRRQGLAMRTCARLLRKLQESAAHIGLNVRADNAGAIACYQHLVFELNGEYGEFTIGTI